jgi:hypothetical protein
MAQLMVTITHTDGSITVEPFDKPLPPKLSSLMAGAGISRPGPGRKLDLDSLNAKLAEKNLSIAARLEIKVALSKAGFIA